MSIVYVGYSQARKGHEDKLRTLLASFVLPTVRASQGNESSWLDYLQAITGDDRGTS